MIGYFLLSIDEVQERLCKYAVYLGIAWFLLMIVRVASSQTWIDMSSVDRESSHVYGLLLNIFFRLYGWVGILACMGLGKRFLSFQNKTTKYFSKASFPLYLFHQSILIIVGFSLVNRLPSATVEYFVIMMVTFLLSVLCYEIARRCPMTRFLFGIKNGDGKKDVGSK